jgi:hypothetical protein
LQIKKRYGDGMVEYVCAVMELVEDHNPSGRYPISVFWDYDEEQGGDDKKKAGDKKKKKKAGGSGVLKGWEMGVEEAATLIFTHLNPGAYVTEDAANSGSADSGSA